jgi:hypothetical protein
LQKSLFRFVILSEGERCVSFSTWGYIEPESKDPAAFQP